MVYKNKYGYVWLTTTNTHWDFPQFFTFFKLCGKEKKKKKNEKKEINICFGEEKFVMVASHIRV